MISPDTAVHVALAIIGAAFALCWLVIQQNTALKVTRAIGSVTAEISKVLSLIEQHVAADTEKHKAIDEHFEFADGRLNRIEGRIFFDGISGSIKKD